MKRICVLLALIVASLPVPTAFATYGVDILPSNSMRSGSLSWGYSDNATCMNGYPNVGESTPNSITTSKYAIENQHNILSVNASVYTFSITVTANNSYDGTYQIKMLDTLGNETSTGQMNIPAGTSRVVTLRFYPKNVLSPITLSLSGRSTLSVDGCNGPVFSSPSLIESAPPPRLSNTWMSSVNLWDLTPTSFSMTTYSQALQSCAVGYAYLIYLANPDGILYLHRTIKISPTQASNNNKYSFTEAKPRTTYYIKEIAYGDLVNCLDSELPGVWPNWRTPGPTTLATPNAPSLTNNSDNSINVSLGTGVTGATDYLFTLYESDSKTIVHSQLVSTGIVGGSIPIAAGLKYGATYFGSLVAKGNGFANESSARSPLTIITIPSDPASPFSDNQCELNPSRPNSITKIQAASGYCIARVETNTSISVPSGVSQMDVLVVGGGGGGGAWVGGGGGGGAVTTSLNTAVSGTISVTVGLGGGGGKYTAALGAVAGTSGGASSFGSITALGGGYGATWSSYAQGAQSTDSTIANGGGGSGSSQFTGGSGSVRTGGNGISTVTAPYPAGGGAGAGANGGTASLGSVNSFGDRYCESLGGNGGNGLRDSNGISGSTSNYFGGGGGGGVHGYVIDNVYLDYCAGLPGGGGLGGGADGLTPESNPYGPQTGFSGKAFTGGGGGGVGHTSANASYGGVGGSGVVYLRWRKPTNSLQSVSLSQLLVLPTYQSQVTLTANLVGADARVTFYQNGKRIPGCISLKSVSLNVACNWKVSQRNVVSITAIATSGNGSSQIASVPLNVFVGRRTTLR